MGYAERNIIKGITPQPVKKESLVNPDIENFNSNMARYEELKQQLEKEIIEFNDAYQAVVAWHKEIQSRQEEMKGLKACLDYEKALNHVQ